MNEYELEVLIESAVGAFRERDPDGRILPSPAWRDLPAEAREGLFDRQSEARAIERALDRRGLSTTVRAVLARIGG